MRAAALVALAGCSVIEMKPPPRDYDPRTIPRCEADAIYAVGDVAGAIVFGALATLVAVVEPKQEVETSERVALGVGSGLVAAALVGSAIAGFRWSKACENAKAQWDVRQIEQDTLVQKSKQAAPPDARDASPVARATPRGHFCTASTTAGLCARERADCETARDAALAAIADLGACILVESAQCFDADGRERCFPTAEQCAARSNGVTCGERK